jgi:hypothetical protein
VTPPWWLMPIVVSVVLAPVVMTGVGLVVVALRPVRSVELAVVEPPVVVVEPEPTPDDLVDEEVSAPPPIDPGEARPAIPGQKPLVVGAPAPEPVAAVSPRAPKCERFGTAIDFVRSPAVAFAQAAAEGKLVLVLHLAGHFEDPGFT